ncbi:MAG: hemolysin family protein [Beduini sp.]|uniref:hemolysin family protein n=1 Tax=Beduini sp. TaxID=1922300 RepID=UPI00399091E8
MDPASGNILIQLLFLVFLTLVNAFFAGAEMAIVSVNKNKIRARAAQGDSRATLLTHLFDDSTKFLSTIQVAITFAGFFSSASAATGISQVLANVMVKAGIPYSSTLAVVVVTIILSYFTLVFGELVPKRLALHHAEKFSLMTVKPINFISKMMSPFIKLLSLSTNGVLRLLGIRSSEFEESVSEEEVIAMLDNGSEIGVFNEQDAQMINSIFLFDDKTARDIMTPSVDVYAIDINEPIKNYLDELLNTYHSRVPVYDEDIDDIIGVLNMKDFMIEARHHSFEEVDIRKIMKDPYFIPDSKNTKELFTQLQNSSQHMAILIDEYGAFSGIVTMVDLVEEIVGDLNDEYDFEEDQILCNADGSYVLDGKLSLVEINEDLDLNLTSVNSDTLSGLVIEKLGYIPKPGAHPIVVIDDLEFTVVEIHDLRIEKVKLNKKAVTSD